MCAYSRARLREGTSSRPLLLTGGSSMPGRVSQLSSLVHLSFSSPESDVHEADHSPSLNSELLLRTQSRIHAHAHKHTHVSTPRKSQGNPLSWRALASRMSTFGTSLISCWVNTSSSIHSKCPTHPWLALWERLFTKNQVKNVVAFQQRVHERRCLTLRNWFLYLCYQNLGQI